MGWTSASRSAVPLPLKPSGNGGDAAAPLPGIARNGRGARNSGAGLEAVGGSGGDNYENSAAAPSLLIRPFSVDGLEEDAAVQGAAFLTREEVLRRRLRRVRQLGRYYRRHYWGLVEVVRVRHRDYYWNFGLSPVRAEGSGRGVERDEDGGFPAVTAAVAVEGSGESGGVGVGFGAGEVGRSRKREKDRCAFCGCTTKPMAVTTYCHLHILSDQKQKLYRACTYHNKRWMGKIKA